MNSIFLDCEVYANYFLCCIKHKGKFYNFEIYNDKVSQNFDKLKDVMTHCEIIGFNTLKYDYPIIQKAILTKSNIEIKKLNDEIINKRVIHYPPKDWFANAIDIIEPAPAVGIGLKMYEARLHYHNLQDLPIDPDTILTPKQCDEIKEYCKNDIDATQCLYEAIKHRIDLRRQISKDNNINVNSKSDAQIAEAILRLKLQEKNINVYPDKSNITKSFKYTPPSFLKFKSKVFNDFFMLVKNTTFKPNEKGKILLPKELGQELSYNKNAYRLGIGGIHSTKDKNASYYANSTTQLIDKDVTSYYPSIIINNSYHPEHLTKEFLNIYRDIYKTRLKAKKENDKNTADTFKIVLNGSFGKFGSVYSFLYSPKMLIHTTLTGQLSLLMLIEKLEDFNITVLSANTDGITCEVSNANKKLFETICKMWEEKTNFSLEDTEYKSIHYRDVNNYIAICTNGEVKRKGCYADTSLMKSPTYQVIYDAIVEYLTNNTPINEYINSCEDVTKFITIRRITGGGTWRGNNIGKVARWFKSKDGETIYYANKKLTKSIKQVEEYKNFPTHAKVATSDNAYLCLDLNEVCLLDKIDKDWYISEAYTQMELLQC